MSDIVIRHAEPKDIDAIRQIHAQPEVYHNTLQVPAHVPAVATSPILVSAWIRAGTTAASPAR